MKYEIKIRFAHICFQERISSLMLLLSLESRQKMYLLGNFQWLINRPKTSAAEAEGRLLKSFGIGWLCSALVIVWFDDSKVCKFYLLSIQIVFHNFSQIKHNMEVSHFYDFVHCDTCGDKFPTVVEKLSCCTPAGKIAYFLHNHREFVLASVKKVFINSQV